MAAHFHNSSSAQGWQPWTLRPLDPKFPQLRQHVTPYKPGLYILHSLNPLCLHNSIILAIEDALSQSRWHIPNNSAANRETQIRFNLRRAHYKGSSYHPGVNEPCMLWMWDVNLVCDVISGLWTKPDSMQLAKTCKDQGVGILSSGKTSIMICSS